MKMKEWMRSNHGEIRNAAMHAFGDDAALDEEELLCAILCDDHLRECAMLDGVDVWGECS